jgi:hypothetical protein
MSAFAGGLGRWAANLLLGQMTEAQKREFAGTGFQRPEAELNYSGNMAFGNPFMDALRGGIAPYEPEYPMNDPSLSWDDINDPQVTRTPPVASPPPIASPVQEPSAVDARPSEQPSPLVNAIASRMKSPITSTTEGISTGRPTVGTPF